ncbi:hypothetical protein CITRIK5_70704 [Citricoccus sp. K5]|nr:hypothetical protein CITRIK5_70704 [Citricoccus sp. K5]
MRRPAVRMTHLAQAPAGASSKRSRNITNDSIFSVQELERDPGGEPAADRLNYTAYRLGATASHSPTLSWADGPSSAPHAGSGGVLRELLPG